MLINIPSDYRAEAEWAFSVIFGEFFGLNFEVQEHANSYFLISHQGCVIKMPCHFFEKAAFNWLGKNTLPTLPLANWDIATTGLTVPLVDQPLPVLFGLPRLEIAKNSVRFSVDVIGTVFFMLSRYEEAVLSERDDFDRFPSSASTAGCSGFLDRPIVDEYAEVLWAAMKHLWPMLERKARLPRTLVSCDVDIPYDGGVNSTLGLLKRLGGDILKRRSLSMASQSIINGLCAQRGDYTHDPYLNAIDWIMDENEKAGNQVAFYFITAHSHPTLDGCYNMDEPVIRKLLKRIYLRGHEIGLHASYNSYQDVAQTCRESNILRQVMSDEGIRQERLGGRQHFLRWRTSLTACNWDAAGMDYDSTLSFADRPGFRCGTCREFPMYDLTERRALKLRQRPLIVMECSVIDKRYMGLGYGYEALKLMKNYKRKCNRLGGDFTLLWHNSHLMTEDDQKLYLELIQ